MEVYGKLFSKILAQKGVILYGDGVRFMRRKSSVSVC